MTTEQKVETEEPKEEASKETGTVSDKKADLEAEETTEITFKTQAELDEHLDKLVQSKKDVELQPINRELKELREQVKKQDAKLSHKGEDGKFARLVQAERTEFGDTQELKDAQEIRTAAIDLKLSCDFVYAFLYSSSMS